MKRSLPPLNWFRAFDAAARHMSFTAAAEELGMTQSAVSQHIAALEDRLGTKLFLRKPRGLALTEAGRLLVADVAEALDQLRRATSAFEPASAGDVVTIATSASIARWYLVPNLADFHACNPAARIRIVTTVWPDEFSTTASDIEVRFGTKEVAGRDAQELDDGRLLAVAKTGVDADLAYSPLIQTVGTSQDWPSVLSNVPGQKPREADHFVDTHGLVVDLAAAGAGISLASELIARPAIDLGLLKAMDIGQVHAKERFFLSTSKETEPTKIAPTVQWLQRLFRAQKRAEHVA